MPKNILSILFGTAAQQKEMFGFKAEQQKVFSDHFLKRFEEEMLDHVKEFFPSHYATMKETGARHTIRYGYEQAKTYGFYTRRNVCLYINAMLLLGSHFDHDPQYSWAQTILSDDQTGNALVRIDRLADKAEEVFEQMCGPDQVHLDAAYQNMHDNYQYIVQHIFREKLSGSLDYLRMIFPEKYKVIGSGNLQQLVRYGVSYAGNYGITDKSNIWVYIIFMFLLGSGFNIDPQFPWAGKILRDNSLAEIKKMELLSLAGRNCLKDFL